MTSSFGTKCAYVQQHDSLSPCQTYSIGGTSFGFTLKKGGLNIKLNWSFCGIAGLLQNDEIIGLAIGKIAAEIFPEFKEWAMD